VVESPNQQVKLFVQAKCYKSALIVSVLHAPGWKPLLYLIGTVIAGVSGVQYIPHLPWW
jgi:hypothetical protein